MRTLLVRGDDPDPGAIAAAVAALERDDLIVYPTDTLYALGGLALSPRAAGRVRAAKGRDAAKPLPVVVADQKQALDLCVAWPPVADLLAEVFWPGPLTLVLEAAAVVPPEVTTPGRTVAVRVPGLELARRLCRAAGPLIATSANVSGRHAPSTCAEAVAALQGVVALALDAGPGHARPSTIVDVSVGAPSLVREGVVPWSRIQAVLRGTAS